MEGKQKTGKNEEKNIKTILTIQKAQKLWTKGKRFEISFNKYPSKITEEIMRVGWKIFWKRKGGKERWVEEKARKAELREAFFKGRRGREVGGGGKMSRHVC